MSGPGAATKYVTLRRLAAGGMAEVELAKQVGIDGFEKLVVLKRIRPEHAHDGDYVTRFFDEARTAADLRHPNLVQVYEAGRDGSGFFLAMAWVHGVSLRELSRTLAGRNERCPLEHALLVASEAARGLHYAHEKRDMRGHPLGIVHRDVSPQNILLSFQGEVKVADFGIARADNQRHETRPGHVWGKLAYMAPEQARGGNVTAATDQFALGVVIWELLAGERLFHRESDAETLRAVLLASAPRIGARVPGFPESLDTLLLRALDPEPRNRFPDCGAFADAIEDWAAKNAVALSPARLGELLRSLFPAEAKEITVGAGPPPPAPPPGRMRPARPRRAVVAGAFGVAALVIAGPFALGAVSRASRRQQARAAIDEGRFEEALDSLEGVLRHRPGDRRALEMAVLAAGSLAEERSRAHGARPALEWLQALCARAPALAAPLESRRLVLEARLLADEAVASGDFAAVSDFVRRHSHRPEIARETARALRGRAPAAKHLWMSALAHSGGLPLDPECFDEAIEIFRSEVITTGGEFGTAHAVAWRMDPSRLRTWGHAALSRGEGFEAVNAAATLSNTDREWISDLHSLLTMDKELAEEDFPVYVSRLRKTPPEDRARMLRTLRTLAGSSVLTESRRRTFVRLQQALES